MLEAVRLSLDVLEDFDPAAPSRGRERRFCCPLPACADKRVDRSHRSLAVNTETGAWICHRCSAAGKLDEHRSSPLPLHVRGRAALERAFRVAERQRLVGEAEDEKVMRRLEQVGPVAGTPSGDYLLGRGISPEVVAGSQLYYAPRWKHWTFQDGTWRLVGVDRRVVFPVCDRDGRIVALSARAIDEQHVEPKVYNVGTLKDGLFATRNGLTSDPLVICEAPIDALSLATLGVPSVALNGTNWPDWLPGVAAFRAVLLATDNDQGGNSAAERLVSALTLGTRCGRLLPPFGKDWNDSLLALGTENLAEQLRQALGEAPSAVGRPTVRSAAGRDAPRNSTAHENPAQAAQPDPIDSISAWIRKRHCVLPGTRADEGCDGIEALLTTVQDGRAGIWIDDSGALHCHTEIPNDPALLALPAHAKVLRELFVNMGGRRCVTDGCYSLISSPDYVTCREHRESSATGGPPPPNSVVGDLRDSVGPYVPADEALDGAA